MMNGVFILLGTNQGDRKYNLEKALFNITYNGIKIINSSSIYQTAAWGITSQPVFFNQAVQIQSDHLAEELLIIFKEIEKEMGRINSVRWGERLIDIDILYFNDLIINKEHLIVPHPQIQNRRFTLVPLVEIAPSFIHPVLNLSQKELLLQCKDPLEVKVLE